MNLARFKTLILSVLVMLSVVLSYMLWHGNWSTTTEVGLSALPTLPAALSPVSSDVTRPYQIVVRQARPAHTALALPSSQEYTAWIRRLGTLSLTGLHQVPQWTMPAGADALECDFGLPLTMHELLPWIPGLENSTFSVKASSVILYQASAASPVNLVLTSPSGSFIAETDVAGKQFEAWINSDENQPGWQAWNAANADYVPSSNVTMPRMVYQTNSASVMPLVDSFFVNPQAVTRIQESKQSVIWTDGSRAVRWDQGQSGLTFEDPNVSAVSPTGVSNLETAMAYIRAHGGSPKDAVLFSETSFFNGDNTQTYTLQSYVDGYPILDALGNYTIELENGHVLRYHRPLLELKSRIQTQQVPLLTGAQLQGILHKLTPTTPLQSLTVQLGYVTEQDGPNQVMLVPAYSISQSGIALWSLDAVTGTVIKGMGAQ